MTATRPGAPAVDVLALGPGTPAAATALLRHIAEAPDAPLGAVVVGPGGTGKTMLLGAVERAYTAAGVPVVRATTGVPAPDTARRCWSTTCTASMPTTWPGCAPSPRPRGPPRRRPPAVAPAARPDGAVRRGHPARPVVVVGHLGRDAVAARIADLVGVAPRRSRWSSWSTSSPAACRPSSTSSRRPCATPAGSTPGTPTPSAGPTSSRSRSRSPSACGPRSTSSTATSARSWRPWPSGRRWTARSSAPCSPRSRDALSATVEAARSTGLLTEAGELIPFVRSLFLRLTPVLRRRELQRTLAAVELDRGGSVLAAGRQLLGTGASGSRIAAVLCAAADEAVDGSPELAVDLLRDAVAAGAPPREVAGRRARALALAGHLDEALRAADTVVADPAAPGRADAAVAAAAALAHRGLLGRSIDLYRSLGPAAAVHAVPGLVVTGAATRVGPCSPLLRVARARCSTAPRRCWPAGC